MHDVSLARGLVSSGGSLIPGLGQSVRYDGTDQLRVSGVSLASSLPAASALSPTSFLFPGADSGFASLPSSFQASSSSSSRNLSVPSVSLSYSFASSSSSSSAPAPSVLSASSSGVPPLSFPPLSSVLPPRSGGSLPPPPPPGFPSMPLASSLLSSSSFSAPGLASSFASYLSLAYWFVGVGGGGSDFLSFLSSHFPHLSADASRDFSSGSSVLLSTLRSVSSAPPAAPPGLSAPSVSAPLTGAPAPLPLPGLSLTFLPPNSSAPPPPRFPLSSGVASAGCSAAAFWGSAVFLFLVWSSSPPSFCACVALIFCLAACFFSSSCGSFGVCCCFRRSCCCSGSSCCCFGSLYCVVPSL